MVGSDWLPPLPPWWALCVRGTDPPPAAAASAAVKRQAAAGGVPARPTAAASAEASSCNMPVFGNVTSSSACASRCSHFCNVAELRSKL